MDLTTDVAEIDADAEMWMEMERLEKERAGSQNVVWKTVSRLWQ